VRGRGWGRGQRRAEVGPDVALSGRRRRWYSSCMRRMRWNTRTRPLPGPRPTDVIIDTGTASLAGRRPENQDRCVADDRFALVSDGMGGHAGGATAAELTTEAATGVLAAGDVEVTAAFEQANERVRIAREEHPELAQMGATLTLASALDVRPEASRWVVAHVGDSPAYLVRADAAVRLTVDPERPGYRRVCVESLAAVGGVQQRPVP